MSFRIHCYCTDGSRKFHFTKEFSNKGDPLESTLFTKLLGQAGVGKAYGDKVKIIKSPTLGATQTALKALTLQYKAHILELALSILQMKEPGQLNIFVRHEHLFWPTTGGNLMMQVNSRRSPREEMVTIYKFLKKNDMHQWEPLLQLCLALNEMDAYNIGSGFMINITLSD